MIDNDFGRIERTVSQYKATFPGVSNPNFINKALGAYMKVSKLDQAKEFYLKSIYEGFKPDDQTIAVLIDGFLKHIDVVKAKEVMQSMTSLGIKPTTKILNIWMNFYLRRNQLEKARIIFRSLEAEGLTPNSATFLNFIRYFINNADFESADKVKGYMYSKGIKPKIEFFNQILQLLFQKNALKQIEDFLEEMQESGLSMDSVTFNVLIEGYAGVNMLDKAQTLIRKMEESGQKPSIVTFNRLLSSQAFALDLQQTKQILVQMNDLGLEFNAFTYAALFKGLVAKQNYPEAISMLYRMEDGSVIVPVEVYSSLLKICCDNNLGAAVHLLRTQMIKNEVSTSPHIYTSLIKFYLRHRHYHQVDGLLLEMQRTKGFIPDLHIFSVLLNHFVEHLDIERISKALEHMIKLGLELNKVIYNVVMKAFYVHCKCLDGGMVYRTELKPSLAVGESLNLTDPSTRRTSVARIKTQFEQTFRIPFKPSIHIFNDLMNSFFHSARYIEALECFEEVLSCDLQPNLFTMTTLIKSRLYLGQTSEAKDLISRMRIWGLKPTILQCALIHHALCRELRTEEAEAFIQEITRTHHLRINYVFYASLIYAYSRCYDHPNVFRTFERLESARFLPDTETCNYVLMSMLEVGQHKESIAFFNKMIDQGILRNAYTYAILVDKNIFEVDTDQLVSCLSDCSMPGNTVDAFPFNKLLRHFYDRSQMSQLKLIFQHMIDYCVRFNWETWPFVAYLFNRCIDTIEDIPLARRLLEKSLVDLESIEELDHHMVDSLKKVYKSSGNHEGLQSFEQFLRQLPDLREKLTQISPALKQVIESKELRKMEIRQKRLSVQLKSVTEELSPAIQVDSDDQSTELQSELRSFSTRIDDLKPESDPNAFILRYLGKTIK